MVTSIDKTLLCLNPMHLVCNRKRAFCRDFFRSFSYDCAKTRAGNTCGTKIAYLDKRIRVETGNDASLETLEGWSKSCEP